MSQTLPLFHDEPYLKQLDCRVDLLERDDAGLPFALLGETVFYPQGGGQLGDRGVLNIALAGEGEALRTLEIVATKKGMTRSGITWALMTKRSHNCRRG